MSKVPLHSFPVVVLALVLRHHFEGTVDIGNPSKVNSHPKNAPNISKPGADIWAKRTRVAGRWGGGGPAKRKETNQNMIWLSIASGGPMWREENAMASAWSRVEG